MSSLLKQDTYYSEFGDSGALYTYPSSVSIKIGNDPRVTVYSVPSEMKRDTNIVSSPLTQVVGVQEFEFHAITVRAGSDDTSFLKIARLEVPNTVNLVKDTKRIFLYADSSYNEDDKIHSLEGHSFMLTGD